jgi:uncharacterized membrane protein YfcA
MRLELFTALGALVGGSIAFLIEERLLALLFAGLLAYVAVSMLRARTAEAGAVAASGDALAGGVRNMPLGLVGATGAGVVSALLGVGGGIIKVPLMHLGMGVPLRVSTATSNLMVGITGAGGAVIYLIHGEIDPYVAGPTVIGVFLGASLGSRVAHRIDLRVLRWLFVAVLLYTAIQMLLRVIG